MYPQEEESIVRAFSHLWLCNVPGLYLEKKDQKKRRRGEEGREEREERELPVSASVVTAVLA